MRVLLVTHYYADHRGGVEIVAAELARRLADRGVGVTWAASGPAGESPHDDLTLLPMTACNLTEKRLGFPYPIWGPISLWRLCRAVWQCDVVHLHDCLYLGNVIAYLCARVMRKPVVVTQHVGLVPYSRVLLRGLLALANRTLGRLVLGGARQTVFISEKVREYFRRRVRFRHAPGFLPNGVDRARFSPVDSQQRLQLRDQFGWPTDQLVMLFVGRFVEKKGLRVMERLARAFPQCRWVFAGWGPDDPARWDLPQVQCLGPAGHEDLPDVYRAADLLVLPSVGEGFPLVIQEAMACGTPVLTSDDTARGMSAVRRVAYVSDLSWESLESQVKQIVEAPASLREWRHEVARFAAERWDWDACAEEYLRLFFEVVRPGRMASRSPASEYGLLRRPSNSPQW